MDAFKRSIGALLILIGGFAVAWMYRIDPDAEERSPQAAKFDWAAEQTRATGSSDRRSPLQGVPLPTPFDPTAAMLPPPKPAPSPRVEPPPMSTWYEAARVPPPLPPVLEQSGQQPLSQPVPPQKKVKSFANRNRPSLLPKQDASPPKTAQAPVVAARPTSPPATRDYRMYTIVEGDTLRRIARRHLGSADRHMEIFALNRSLLSDPEVLPLGKQIKLPPKSDPPVTPSPHASGPASGLTTDDPHRPATNSQSPRLVPLPADAFSRH
ncbi:MAG: LysM peptidoglycan-binding domain-containing protein [Planctomycetales bacterium]|nr:LysM peptidoglycan-binding domain-containing protein [Planctomycetales bacterium]NIM07744.1 LysM peptidoglycan-binding domain-containing protein [Planctomycetales bacterium]NIN07243.1 LysM peptidoglycan-binding domain-containing protein [Planctomycetales bacterium]NIN76336.1 LysM peptidoglycan-binding domain-containing protein [Planctomycetales bacterium]NIO33546.1 LysM peptidoglycan-binding domain-containing protein [Planctomycetales bacterium]